MTPALDEVHSPSPILRSVGQRRGTHHAPLRAPAAGIVEHQHAARYRALLQPLTLELCRGAVNRCSVGVLAEDGETLVPIAGSEVIDARAAAFGERVGAFVLGRPGSLRSRVLDTKAPELVDTADIAPGTFDEQDAAWVEAFVAAYGHTRFYVVPLLVDAEPLGVASFGLTDDIPVKDLRSLEHMAHRIALTILCARLAEKAASDAERHAATIGRLEATAALWETVQELSGEGLALLESDGTIIRANAALGLLTGRAPRDLAGLCIDEIIEGDRLGPDPLDGSGPDFWWARGPRDPTVSHTDGRRIPVRVSARSLGDSRGRSRAILVQLVDCTLTLQAGRRTLVRRLVVEALSAPQMSSGPVLDALCHHVEDIVPDTVVSFHLVSRPERRLQTVAAPSMSAAGVRALDEVFIDRSEVPYAIAALAGCAALSVGVQDAGAGHACWRSAGPGDRKAVWAVPVSEGTAGEVMAVLVVHRDSARAPDEKEMATCEDAAGVAAVCIVREREQALLAAHERTHRNLITQQTMLLNQVRDSVIQLDLAGCVTYANAAAEATLGWTPGELTSRSFHQTVHHSLADGTPHPYGRSMIARSAFEGTVNQVRGDVFWSRSDRPILVDYTCSPLEDDERCTGVALVFSPSTWSGGEPPLRHLLTERERHVLHWLAQGLRGEDAALRMHISNSTLQSHLKNAIAKLGASGRTQAVVLAAARGEIDLSQFAGPNGAMAGGAIAPSKGADREQEISARAGQGLDPRR